MKSRHLFELLLVIASFSGYSLAQSGCLQLEEDQLVDPKSQNSGLIPRAYTLSGENIQRPTVSLHQANIVCLAAAEERGTYQYVSVVANHTCISQGSLAGYEGVAVVSQFDFQCVDLSTTDSVPPQWSPIVQGSSAFVLEPIADGSLSTPLRTDCLACVNPRQRGLSDIDPNHCDECSGCLSNGSMMCTSVGPSACCNFYLNNTCVLECPPTTAPNDTFDCVDCGDLSAPTNGVVLLSGTGLGAIASYFCMDGFTRIGNNRRTCQVNGQWSGEEPTCSIVRCEVVPIENGNTRPSVESITFGSAVSYVCDDGYALSGLDLRTCREDGLLTGSQPTCAADVDCGLLNGIANGTVVFNSTLLGAVATYFCNRGFSLDGNTNRTCVVNGTWFPSGPPECVITQRTAPDDRDVDIAWIVIGVLVIMIIIGIIVALVVYGIYRGRSEF